MKRSHIFVSGFLLLQLFLPICLGLGYWLGRPFQAAREAVFFLLLAGASLLLTVKLYGEAPTRLAMPALLFSILNGITVLLFTQWWGGALAAVTVIVCGWAVFYRTPEGLGKRLCYVLCVLLTMSLLLLVPLWLFVTAMGQTTVISETDSPDGRFTARLIDVDAGATGGDTLVKVRDNAGTLSIGIGSFVKEQTVYSGSWGEFRDMTLYWEDRDTLRINGKAYPIGTQEE